ncbi:hypothetical protein I7I50_07740 [Histoplasma capsulatum G186AR]|nr:hypothetical protein I7I50_07740 [Histoplasma capsulatum G186AR]
MTAGFGIDAGILVLGVILGFSAAMAVHCFFFFFFFFIHCGGISVFVILHYTGYMHHGRGHFIILRRSSLIFPRL